MYSPSIDEIAGHLHISKVYLQRIFKRETGMTIGDYLRKVKIDYAEYLLKNTAFLVGDIDEMVGFASRQAFYQAFKKVHGISPDAYRRSFDSEA